MSSLMKLIKNPAKIVFVLDKLKISKLILDRPYLRLKYRACMNKKLNLKNPHTFNEKLNWLKLHDRKSEYTMMVDKYEVKNYVAKILGDEYIIPTLGVWEKVEKIDFDLLPNQFVLKCTHDSGGVVICKDKSELNIETAKKTLRKALMNDFYFMGREWPYKNVKRKIIAERYMEEADGSSLKDYKFFCFNGEPKMILVCADRFSIEGLKENFYDIEWNLMNIRRPKHPNTDYEVQKPEKLNEMISLAKKLATEIPFSRIDFYVINNHIYFGEITFFPASGMENFEPKEWDHNLGKLIRLPNIRV